MRTPEDQPTPVGVADANVDPSADPSLRLAAERLRSLRDRLVLFALLSGGVASLNHRLIAGIPIGMQDSCRSLSENLCRPPCGEGELEVEQGEVVVGRFSQRVSRRRARLVHEWLRSTTQRRAGACGWRFFGSSPLCGI